MYTSGGRAGFEDNSACCSSVVLETDSNKLDGYGLTASIGPISGTSFIATGENNQMVNGSFGSSSVPGQTSTFTATVGAAPEPGSFLLPGAGIAGIAAVKLQSRR